ncbi:hypothetical protein FLONG3_1096 [Fusarium longipes]|uniref:Arrestin-like N-terminal domain-containing protein n=1 Tax=Fusarium longipes TaxID=694270 RepID=A0A395T8I6_9HYPO|nr:hypothetical protein FLONG3_1096 [Fusarium longipes]
MHPETLKSNRSLGIRLDKDTYAPGDTITGHVYRKSFISSPQGAVSCCFHAGASVDFGPNRHDNSAFTLLSCHQQPELLFCGPLYIFNTSKEEQWPFSFEIPIYADSTCNKDNRSPSYTPVGATDHVLPPTYAFYSPGVVVAYVEYCIVAKIEYYDLNKTILTTAKHPVKLVHYSPNPPIVDFKVKRCRYPRSVSFPSLTPGRQDSRLSHWVKRSSRKTHDPAFAFELSLELPTIIQLDNPSPIPLRLAIHPNWEETWEILKNLPQKFTLTSVKVLLVTYTNVMTKGMIEKQYIQTVDLGVLKALERLSNEVQIPCTDQWDPVDIGQMINLRIGLKKTGFPFGRRVKNDFTPSFRTYNMTLTHGLQWNIEAKVAGEKLSFDGEADILLLRSSDQREQSPSPVEEPIITDARQALDEDDSWIRPPPEEEAPPSFVDALVTSDAVAQER